MVVFRSFTKVADHERPNLRGRVQQWAARSSTMKPDRASRVRRRLKMPVLCAFCAWPVRVRLKTSHEPPLRTRTVGGVGAGSEKLPATRLAALALRSSLSRCDGRLKSSGSTANTGGVFLPKAIYVYRE